MPHISTVIYDVDGTMVDSEPLHVAAWDDALSQWGYGLSDLPEEFRATMAGKKPLAIAEGMVGALYLPVSPADLLRRKMTVFLAMIPRNLVGMPGVVESVHRLTREGYELAIGTSLDREYVATVLDRLGLEGAFRVIVTGEQIVHGKPHPETYLTVAMQLAREPNECVVLEDAQSGIQAAKAAGMYCIAVENLRAVPQDTSEADVMVSSLDHVTPVLIRRLAGEIAG